MKKNAFLFLFFCIVCVELFSQKCDYITDSLFVYTVVDREITAIIDSFIIETQSIKYLSMDYFLYFQLRGDNALTIILDCRKKKEVSDSVFLFKNPHYNQAFILHQDILFKANFTSDDITKYCNLSDFLKKYEKKQFVYFINAPSDFYDISLKGEIDYEDELMSYLVDFHNGKLFEKVIFYFYLDDYRTDYHLFQPQ